MTFFDKKKLKSLLSSATGATELTQSIRSQLGLKIKNEFNQSFTSLASSEKDYHSVYNSQTGDREALTLEDKIL